MARKRKIVNTIVCQDSRRLPSLPGWNKIGPAGATGSMSADLFDFHRGGDGVERMTDGEKRKLTLLNPMRNVGFAVSLFFSPTVSHHSGVSFQRLPPALRTFVRKILQGVNSA